MNKTAIRPEIEKLIIWLVPLVVISKSAEFISRMLFSKIAALNGTAEITSSFVLSLLDLGYTVGELLLILQWVQVLPGLLINAAIGYWLFNQSNRVSGRKWLWLAGGICLSYWALAFHFFSLLLQTERNEPSISDSHNI